MSIGSASSSVGKWLRNAGWSLLSVINQIVDWIRVQSSPLYPLSTPFPSLTAIYIPPFSYRYLRPPLYLLSTSLPSLPAIYVPFLPPSLHPSLHSSWPPSIYRTFYPLLSISPPISITYFCPLRFLSPIPYHSNLFLSPIPYHSNLFLPPLCPFSTLFHHDP